MKSDKLYPNLVRSVVEALGSIFGEGYYADKVVERSMRSQPKWGGRDRRFFAESVYEIVRWKRLLEFCAQTKVEEDALSIFATWWYLRTQQEPQELGCPILGSEILSRHKKAQETPEIRESMPDWIYGLGKEQLGEIWDLELGFLNQKAAVILRTNTLVNSKLDLKKLLAQEGVEAEEIVGFPEALRLLERKNVFITQSYKKGGFEVQDASSQRVAHFMELDPGMRVVDACAGAGGKSLHMAALMENKGKVISMDIEDWKLKELKKRATRARVDIIETRKIEGTKTIKRLADTADRLLLDVPCTGLGVLRRNPDTKWKLTEKKYEELLETQKNILSSYSRMVRVEGKLVYSTCSILPSENKKQIQTFLGAHSEWKLEDELSVYPSEGHDGFYMARLRRLKK